VKFREIVVHSIENWAAEVANDSDFRRPNDYHHHAKIFILQREELARAVVDGGLSLKEAAAEFKLNPQSRALGQAVPAGGSGRA
jgi:hypothetical protein